MGQSERAEHRSRQLPGRSDRRLGLLVECWLEQRNRQPGRTVVPFCLRQARSARAVVRSARSVAGVRMPDGGLRSARTRPHGVADRRTRST